MVVEMAINITSHEELMVWLAGKPSGSLEVMAFRTALKTAVWAFDPDEWHDEGPARSWVLSTFLALTFSSQMIFNPSNIIWSPRIGSGREVLPSFGPAPLPSIASNRAVAAGDFASFCMTLDYTDLFAAGFRNGDLSLDIILDDIDELDRTKNPQRLLQQPLWKDRPVEWSESWDRARRWLSSTKDGFDIWREWYHGRIEGLPHVFKDFDGEADSAFYRWLLEQRDEWWRREPGQINADIKAKVEELRKPEPPADEELKQNPRAFTFSLNEDGQSEVDEEVLPNGLQGDADERDNHSEVLRLIDAAIEATAGDTNAKDMGNPTQLLRDAAGDTVEALRPRLFVLRAREIIRQVNEREGGDSLKPPLSERQRDAYVPLVAGLEMIAEFSPKLAELWYGKMGQSGPPLTRETLDLVALAFRQSQQTTEIAQSIIEASNALVKPDAPDDDPARIAASETSRNVVRKMGGALKKADEGAKSVDRVMRLSDRAIIIWNSVKGHLPSNETIARILKWIFFSGG